MLELNGRLISKAELNFKPELKNFNYDIRIDGEFNYNRC